MAKSPSSCEIFKSKLDEMLYGPTPDIEDDDDREEEVEEEEVEE